MELLLNLFWLMVSATAIVAVPRRSSRVSLALICAAAILFPIVSLSDDLSLDRDALEEALAVIVTPVLLATAMVTFARIASIRVMVPAMTAIVSCDPRSPPRG